MGIGILAAMGAFMASQGLVSGMLYQYPPYISGRARQTYPETPNVLPDIDKLVAMRYKGEISSQDFLSTANELGYADEWAHGIEDASRRMMDGESYVRIWRRGIIDEQQLSESLSSLHFQEEDIAHIKSATEFFPQPVDLIRFAVREVYNPTIRAKFEMDEDISDNYLAEAFKAGVPEEQARNFWAAHWDLPSPLMAFEMLHRDVIKEDELNMLLKALDIMPYWRDKLTQIAYTPLTRVDVRRMHSVGVLDETQVNRAYQDIGFSPDNAELMTTFTVQYNARSSTGITRANVMKAYKMGLMTREELVKQLDTFGFTSEVISFWVSLADYEKRIEHLEEYESQLFVQYRKGLINADQLRDALIKSGLPDDYVQTSILKVQTEVAKKTRMPSKAEVEKWMVLNIIDEFQWTDYMRRLGYRNIDIERYLTEIVVEDEDRAVKYLGIATYKKWLTEGIISARRFVELATLKGHSAEDIQNLMRTAGISTDELQNGLGRLSEIYGAFG